MDEEWEEFENVVGNAYGQMVLDEEGGARRAYRRMQSAAESAAQHGHREAARVAVVLQLVSELHLSGPSSASTSVAIGRIVRAYARRLPPPPRADSAAQRLLFGDVDGAVRELRSLPTRMRDAHTLAQLLERMPSEPQPPSAARRFRAEWDEWRTSLRHAFSMEAARAQLAHAAPESDEWGLAATLLAAMGDLDALTRLSPAWPPLLCGLCAYAAPPVRRSDLPAAVRDAIEAQTQNDPAWSDLCELLPAAAEPTGDALLAVLARRLPPETTAAAWLPAVVAAALARWGVDRLRQRTQTAAVACTALLRRGERSLRAAAYFGLLGGSSGNQALFLHLSSTAPNSSSRSLLHDLDAMRARLSLYDELMDFVKDSTLLVEQSPPTSKGEEEGNFTMEWMENTVGELQLLKNQCWEAIAWAKWREDRDVASAVQGLLSAGLGGDRVAELLAAAYLDQKAGGRSRLQDGVAEVLEAADADSLGRVGRAFARLTSVLALRQAGLLEPIDACSAMEAVLALRALPRLLWPPLLHDLLWWKLLAVANRPADVSLPLLFSLQAWSESFPLLKFQPSLLSPSSGVLSLLEESLGASDSPLLISQLSSLGCPLLESSVFFSSFLSLYSI